jgi:hypothetical protein
MFVNYPRATKVSNKNKVFIAKNVYGWHPPVTASFLPLSTHCLLFCHPNHAATESSLRGRCFY